MDEYLIQKLPTVHRCLHYDWCGVEIVLDSMFKLTDFIEIWAKVSKLTLQDIRYETIFDFEKSHSLFTEMSNNNQHQMSH